MATITVKQTGGDFSTLASALSDGDTAADDIISIEGTWTVDDTASATVADDTITIQTDASSYHDGVYDETNNHYRLQVSDGNHSLTINNTGCIVDGLAIVQEGSGSSDEGVRISGSIAVTTIKRCVVRTPNGNNFQDGIYSHSGADATVNVENCIVYGFGRGGIHYQVGSGTDTKTLNINSCTLVDNGLTAASGQFGGVLVQATGGSVVVNINVFNTISIDNTSQAGADYDEYSVTGTTTWNIDDCIAGDGSIASRDSGAVGAQANRTLNWGSSSGGNEVILTTDGTNFLLVDDATNNDAQDAHSNTSGAGLSLPTLDIEDETRDTASNKVDVGADAFPSVGFDADLAMAARQIGGTQPVQTPVRIVSY